MTLKSTLSRSMWLGIICLAPVCASAQSRSAEAVVGFLVTAVTVQTGDFVKDAQAAEATRATLTRSLLADLTTTPITTSAGGFSYRFDSGLGTLERVSRSFGPFFVDRASTAGDGHASVSVAFRRSEFLTFDGRDLRDGSFVTNSNRFRDEDAPFDVDALKMDIRVDSATVLANYGFGNRTDIGVAIPIVRLIIDGERSNVYRGTSQVQARGRVESIGIGDIPIRAKIRVFEMEGVQAAAMGEVQLPTGDPANLRGTGRLGGRAALLLSAGHDNIEAHVNAGIAEGGLARQVFLTGAINTSVGDRLTFTGETLIRRMAGLSGIRDVSEPHPTIKGVDTVRLLPVAGERTHVSLVGGLRWNLSGTWLLNAYLMLPITDTGLKARPLPALSVDYSFIR